MSRYSANKTVQQDKLLSYIHSKRESGRIAIVPSGSISEILLTKMHFHYHGNQLIYILTLLPRKFKLARTWEYIYLFLRDKT